MARVAAAILCDFAEVRENLLFVLSGGVSRVRIPQLPEGQDAENASVPLHVGVLVEIGPDEREQVHEIRIALANPDLAESRLLAAGGFKLASPGDLLPGEPKIQALSFPVPIPASRLGQWDVKVTVDEETTLVSVWVVGAAPEVEL